MTIAAVVRRPSSVVRRPLRSHPDASSQKPSKQIKCARALYQPTWQCTKTPPELFASACGTRGYRTARLLEQQKQFRRRKWKNDTEKHLSLANN